MPKPPPPLEPPIAPAVFGERPPPQDPFAVPTLPRDLSRQDVSRLVNLENLPMWRGALSPFLLGGERHMVSPAQGPEEFAPFDVPSGAGVLRAPLLGTKAKYVHPTTGEEPTRVYHGSKHAFTELDPAKADPAALYGPGHYFTENPDVAAGYAGKPLQVNYDAWVAAGREAETPRPNIRPAHLDVRNPFDIEAKITPGEVRRLFEDAGHPIAEFSENLDQMIKGSNLTGEGVYGSLLAHFGSKSVVNDFLREAGYDGITHIGGARTGTQPHRVWIAFDPKQVVSPFEYAAGGKPLADIFQGGRQQMAP